MITTSSEKNDNATPADNQSRAVSLASGVCKHPFFYITSGLLVITYLIVLICSYESRSVHWLCVSAATIALAIATVACIIHARINAYAYIEQSSSSCVRRARLISLYKNPYFWGICISSIIAYSTLAMLLSTSWLQGDDYAFMGILPEGNTLLHKWKAAAHWYSTWVARFGNFFSILVPLHESKWQVWVINPLLVVSIPFALFRLFRQDNTDTMFSPKGILFLWFCFFSFLLACKVSAYWRDYWCYAASTNYLYPCVGFLWLLSYYNPVNWNEYPPKRAELATYGLFFLAFICGWGMECTAISIVPLMVLWGGYNFLKKTKLPAFCWSGIIGAVWGAFTLLASPAHQERIIKIASSRKLKVGDMSPEQITDFVQNLNWDAVNMLRGGAGLISFDGIPLFQRIYFTPFLLDRWWDCVNVCAIVVVVLFASLYIFPKKTLTCKQLLAVLFCIIFAVGMACSYGVASIPTHMSFLPCSYVVAAVGAYLFFIHSEGKSWSPRQLVITICIAIYSMMLFVPAGVEAWKLRPEKQAWIDEIKRQKSMGIEDVVLPYPVPNPQFNNSLRLINTLTDNPRVYPNTYAARAFKVRSIRQLPYKRPVLPKQEANKQGK